MTQQQNTLLGFLQKQSIFNSSLSPNWRNRSRSRRSRDSEGSKDRLYLTQQQRFYNSRETSPKEAHYPQRDMTSSARYHKEQHRNGLLQDRWESPQNQMQRTQNQMQRIYQSGENSKRVIPSPQIKKDRVIVASETPIRIREGFQTSHIESFQCLENISKKLWVRIIELNHKLENFTRTVKQWISQELLNAQKSILNIVEIAYKEQEALIQAYVAKQQKQMAEHLSKTKSLLQIEYKRVDELQQHLRGPNWRKAAGEILSSQLQKKIENLIQQTSKVDLFEWKPKSYVRDHLKLIELQVRQIFKLKTFP